jgi:hypothetical protein
MRRELTEEEIEAMLDRAYDPDRPRPDNGPAAVSATYDEERQRVMVEFENGCLFGFPASLVRGTEGAPAPLLSRVEILPSGLAVAWREINASADIRGLMLTAFRAHAWAGRYLGTATSPAKAAAARENGKKGGRPRK